eukprot:2397261-Amphidinium_carterae.1
MLVAKGSWVNDFRWTSRKVKCTSSCSARSSIHNAAICIQDHSSPHRPARGSARRAHARAVHACNVHMNVGH